MVEHGFEGHILPGVFFGFFGLWWSFVTSFRYIQSKKKNSNKTLVGYHTSITMPCFCLPCGKLKYLPIESFIKIIFCTAGVIGEIITGIEYHTVPKNGSNEMNHEHYHEDIDKREVSNSTSQPEMIEKLWLVPGLSLFKILKEMTKPNLGHSFYKCLLFI